jgi:hypothetical protein
VKPLLMYVGTYWISSGVIVSGDIRSLDFLLEFK